MAHPLTCPHCQAEFGFDDWSKTASCPACGRRVSFFAATGRPEPGGWETGAAARVAPALAGAPLVTTGATPYATVGAARTARYTLFGKPLMWTRAWTIVVLVWLMAAAALGVARVSMGHMAVLTPSELAAVKLVQAQKLPTGVASEAVLQYLATHDPSLTGQLSSQLLHTTVKGTATWYAVSRPWEHRIYVSWELPERGLLFSWIVEDGTARPDDETRLALAKAAQAMAHPMAKGSLPAVPGVIPSIPPDLEDTPAP
ncbi:MAG TPA: hypothetical protein VK576_08235 [Thermoleophilia bacterium]|nr:hypothetical protein [Thermoleophilia bacterium]